MELLTIAKSIKDAKCPEDVFGGDPDGSSIMKVYRQLILVIHPDHFESQPKELKIANEAFTLLTALKGDADRKVKVGTYGKRNVKAPPPKEPFRPSIIEAGSKRYVLVDDVASGDLGDLFVCTVVNGAAEHKALFKITKDGRDNDLMENEFKALQKLYAKEAARGPKDPKEVDLRFFLEATNTFLVRGPSFQRRVNILTWFPEHRGLDEVLRVFPDGIDYKDMVWMFKRVLQGIGWAHKHHLIHGALIPPHILIHPVDHGAKLVDWCYSVDITPDGKKPSVKKPRTVFDHLLDDGVTNPHVKAISQGYRDYYPPEVFKKETPTAATDIYMAAKCAVALVGGDVKTNAMPTTIPATVRAFFERCLHADPKKRPQGAWDAHEELDGVLLKAVGKRAYRPFPMPEVRAV